MTIISSLPYLAGLLVGLLLGLYYFYGLLLTVQRVVGSRNPKRVLAVSYLLRLLPVLLVMILSVRKNPGIFIAILSGFFLVRFMLTRKIANLTMGEGHAPQP